MKNVTKLASIAIISTTMISAPAMASTSSTPAQPQVEQSVQLDQSLVAQSTTDLDYAFADEANVQALALTNDEMVETEGAWIPVVLGIVGRFVTSPVARHHLGNAALASGVYYGGKGSSNSKKLKEYERRDRNDRRERYFNR